MKKNITIYSFTIILLFFSSSVFSISNSEKSNKDYRLTTNILREIKPMVLNFKTDATESELKTLISQFEIATSEYYSRNYDSSAEKFYNLKLSLITLLEKIANQYITRTEEILQSSIKENQSIELFIGLSKNSKFEIYFDTPFDPLKDTKPYNKDFTVQDYNNYFQAAKIERYLKNGYYYLQSAKKTANDPIILSLKKQTKIESTNANYIINSYMDAISYCRIAKESGIEIYKVLNEITIGQILQKYDIRKNQLTPIFDDRIPEKYKADAVDNKQLLFSIETEKREKILKGK